MGVFAGAWFVTDTLTLTSAPGSTSRALGLLLFIVAAAPMVPTAVATLGKVVAALVMFGAGARFALTAVYELSGTTSWEHISGWWGSACVWSAFTPLWPSRLKTPAGARYCRWAVGERDDEL